MRGAEVLHFKHVGEEARQPYTQGLELRLGFYDEDDLEVVRAQKQQASEELSKTIGGSPNAVQVNLVSLLKLGGDWHSSLYQSPPPLQPKHLHRYMLQRRASTPENLRPSARERLNSNELLIVARRLRWRLGVDHARPPAEATNLIFWTTATGEMWSKRVPKVEMLVMEIGSYVLESSCSADDARFNPDDWGVVSLDDDPLEVLAIGPWSSDAATHADVKTVLNRAGPQLRVTWKRLPTKEEEGNRLKGYIKWLQELAQKDGLLEGVDLVLVYRGGGLHEVTVPDKVDMMSAARDLAGRGVEVVIGISHGDLSVLPHGADLPVGVFEAITPTAAAQWILREHVNTRLVDSIPDPGQAR